MSRLRVYALLTAALLGGCNDGGVVEEADRAVFTTDICVYGGSSAGVMAAVAAARMGKDVVLVEPGTHLGGMSSSGLSWTDLGAPNYLAAIGGLAREFYQRVGRRYGEETLAAAGTPADGSSPVGFARPAALAFEPQIAEQVFNELLAEADVTVVLGQQIVAVRLAEGRIADIVTSDGARYQAGIFIDATYVGDLIAATGVSYTIGRESRETYNEPLAGIQPPPEYPEAGKFEVPVDPFVEPGKPASGLLPYLLIDEPYGAFGAGDNRIQAYTYRLCLTDRADNRITITPPDGYDPGKYELLGRWAAARVGAGEMLALSDFVKYDPLPNGKYDLNNRWAISTDFLGGSWDYPEGDATRRREIEQQHEAYLRGFLHYLATEPRIPEPMRGEVSRFGLAADEFTGTSGWPHLLYVREGRRMVSDFVMTQHHCEGRETAPRAIGLATYGVDLHAVRRIVHEGQPVNEGSNGAAPPAPFPIAFDAIVPKPAECLNLLAPVCLSASHVAQGSIRTEPTFMILGQSAGVAAVLALEDGVPVQEIDYPRLRESLAGMGQVLNRGD